MNSICIYLFIALLVVFWGYVSQKILDNSFERTLSRKIFCSLLISSPLIFFLSIRYGIGTDYFNYFNSFSYYEKYGFTRSEIGVVAIMDACIRFSQSFQGFIVVTSIITVFLPVFTLLLLSKSWLWLQILALFSLYFGLWSTAIRQSLALGFVFVAIYFVLQREKIAYILSIVFASLFHFSSCLLIPFVFLINKKNENEVNQQWKVFLSALLVFAGIFIFFFWGKENNLVYSNYIGATREGGLTSNYLKLSMLFYLPEIFFAKKICGKQKEYVVLYIMLICEFALYSLSIFVPHSFRMGHYFSIAHIFLLPQIISSFENRDGRFCLILYYGLGFVFYFLATTFIFGYNGIAEYKTIFQGN